MIPTALICSRKYLQVLGVVSAFFSVSERTPLGWGKDLLGLADCLPWNEQLSATKILPDRIFKCNSVYCLEQLQMLKAEVSIELVKKMVSNTTLNISKTDLLKIGFFLNYCSQQFISCSLGKITELPILEFQRKKPQRMILIYTIYLLLWYLL